MTHNMHTKAEHRCTNLYTEIPPDHVLCTRFCRLPLRPSYGARPRYAVVSCTASAIGSDMCGRHERPAAEQIGGCGVWSQREGLTDEIPCAALRRANRDCRTAVRSPINARAVLKSKDSLVS